MSLAKKLLLLTIFLMLTFFTIYEFDYEKFLSNGNLVSEEKSTNLKEKEHKPFNLVLVKKDGLIEMNGLFSSTEDSKKVSDFLYRNREGEYKYENNVVIDENLLEDIAILMTPLKDFFADNSKLTVFNNEVSLTGELKDANYKDLLDSILSKIKIKLKTDVIVPEVLPLDISKNSIDETLKILNNEQITNNNNIDTNQSSKLNEIQLSINSILSTKKINFERRSTAITADSQIIVEDIAKILSDNPTFKVEVAGHTDSRGSDSLNKRISQDRASSVRDILVSLGINKDRITAVGYGEEFPIAKDDENGLSEINRRVEFNILGE